MRVLSFSLDNEPRKRLDVFLNRYGLCTLVEKLSFCYRYLPVLCSAMYLDALCKLYAIGYSHFELNKMKLHCNQFMISVFFPRAVIVVAKAMLV